MMNYIIAFLILIIICDHPLGMVFVEHLLARPNPSRGGRPFLKIRALFMPQLISRMEVLYYEKKN